MKCIVIGWHPIFKERIISFDGDDAYEKACNFSKILIDGGYTNIEIKDDLKFNDNNVKGHYIPTLKELLQCTTSYIKWWNNQTGLYKNIALLQLNHIQSRLNMLIQKQNISMLIEKPRNCPGCKHWWFDRMRRGCNIDDKRPTNTSYDLTSMNAIGPCEDFKPREKEK